MLRALAGALCRPPASGGRSPPLPPDLARDPTRNRLRRFGQALVLAAEWPAGGEWLHAHFIHTPASATRYASLITGIAWTCSAHAKDIWTSRGLGSRGQAGLGALDGHLHRQSASSICAASPAEHGKVHLSYHGLDLDRFGPFAGRAFGPRRLRSAGARASSSASAAPSTRRVTTYCSRRWPGCRPTSHWRFEHIGGGELLGKLQRAGGRTGHCRPHHRGRAALAQDEVLARYRQADIFALACRISGGRRPRRPAQCAGRGIEPAADLHLDDDFRRARTDQRRRERLAGAAGGSGGAGCSARARDPRSGTAQAARRGGRAARCGRRFDYHSSIRQLTALFEQEWQTTP